MWRRGIECPILGRLVRIMAESDERRFGAGDGIRTRDINLGKVALYQLSYSRAPEGEQLSLSRPTSGLSTKVKAALATMKIPSPFHGNQRAAFSLPNRTLLAGDSHARLKTFSAVGLRENRTYPRSPYRKTCRGQNVVLSEASLTQRKDSYLKMASSWLGYSFCGMLRSVARCRSAFLRRLRSRTSGRAVPRSESEKIRYRFPQVWKSCGNSAACNGTTRGDKVQRDSERARCRREFGDESVQSNAWEQIKARLAAKISSSGISELGDADRISRVWTNGTLRVPVPDQVTKEWMEQEYCRRYPEGHSRIESSVIED